VTLKIESRHNIDANAGDPGYEAHREVPGKEDRLQAALTSALTQFRLVAESPRWC
jgi:hypothetical protein